MKIKINEGFLGLKDNYLFSEVARRVLGLRRRPSQREKRLIRLRGSAISRFRLRRASSQRRGAPRRDGRNLSRRYAPERGYAFLLEAVARRYASLGVSLDEDEIFISDGAKESDAGNIADILGDSPVLIPDPVYPVYADSSILAGRRVRMIEGTRENLFLPMPDGIAESNAVFFICSPNNPTGAVYSRKRLKSGWISPAIQDRLSYTIPHTNRSSTGDFPHSIYEIDGAKQCAVRNMQPVKIRRASPECGAHGRSCRPDFQREMYR